jgi:hypothetical protein
LREFFYFDGIILKSEIIFTECRPPPSRSLTVSGKRRNGCDNPFPLDNPDHPGGVEGKDKEKSAEGSAALITGGSRRSSGSPEGSGPWFVLSFCAGILSPGFISLWSFK